MLFIFGMFKFVIISLGLIDLRVVIVVFVFFDFVIV